MSTHVRRYYDKEEEFSDHFFNCAAAASRLMGDEWTPIPDADDSTRKNREYFLETKQANSLAFDGAGVFHNEHGFDHVQIVLTSSFRSVTIKVRCEDNNYIATIERDVQLDPDTGKPKQPG